MSTITNSSISDIDRRAITVTFATDTTITCDVKSQIVVTVNGASIFAMDVVLSSPRTMGILLPGYIFRGDVIEWFYYSGTCKIEDIATGTELTPHAMANAVDNHITEDLIIYPSDSWNSFVSVADADKIINGFVVDAGVTAYLALTMEAKEQILKQTALQIKMCSGIKLPTATTPDLAFAQCYLSTHAIQVNMLSFDNTATNIISEKVDTIAVVYDTSNKVGVETFPPMVSSLLAQYGCGGGNGGFMMASLGRN